MNELGCSPDNLTLKNKLGPKREFKVKPRHVGSESLFAFDVHGHENMYDMLV
jgi:hypothetical protein